jgi:putative pyoverdin transport system ATP-binding/permease protein
MDRKRTSLLKSLFLESRVSLIGGATAGVLSGLSGAAVGIMLGDASHTSTIRTTQALAFFAACVFYLLSKSVSEMLLIRLTQAAVLRLRIMLSQKLLDSSYARLQAMGKSELLAILTADISTFVAAFQTVPQIFGNIIVILLCFLYMAWLSLGLCSVLLLSLLLGATAYRFAERSLIRKLTELRQQIDRLYKSFRGLVEGARELQLHAPRARHYLSHRVGNAAQASRASASSALSGYVWVNNAGGLLFYMVIGLLVFVAPGFVGVDRADLTTFTLVIMFLIRPISESISALPSLRQAGVSWNKIQQLDASLEAAAGPLGHDGDFGARSGVDLRLEAVEYRHGATHGDHAFRVGPIDLTLGSGQIVFIVGGNGSGKTTFSNLLIGLYSPTAGRLILNGSTIDDQTRSDYRQQFSCVLSDFHLFDQIFDPAEGDRLAEARELLALMELADKVDIVEGCFSTVDLSMGQRKRLALVTAFLDDRPIHVYDEWAADQDPEFRRVFYTSLLPRLKAREKLVIVITHDDAYFHCSDRVLRLDDGRLMESPGTEPSRCTAMEREDEVT